MQAVVSKIRKPKITTDIAVITPEIAAGYLEKNHRNRRVSEAMVRRYMRDMTNGNWRLTGDAIRFDANGELLDGQHRLTACVRAKTNFESVVVYGLAPDDQDVIDTGKGRSAQDVLTIRGLANANRVSTALRVLLAYKNDQRPRAQLWSHSDIVGALNDHPNITKSVAKINGFPRSAPYGAFGFMHYVASVFLKREDAADRMIEVMKSGIPSYDGDPIHALRERFIRLSEEAARVNQEYAIWTLYDTWNKFSNSETVQRIVIKKEPVYIECLDRSKL